MKPMLSAFFGFFVAVQSFASETRRIENNLVMECTGSHSANTLVRVYETIEYKGTTQLGVSELSINVRSKSNNEEGGTYAYYRVEDITKNSIPVGKSAFGSEIRKSAEAIKSGEFSGFLFVTAAAYLLENPPRRGTDTLYLSLQRYEGMAPNLMVLNGQVEELDCLPSKN